MKPTWDEESDTIGHIPAICAACKKPAHVGFLLVTNGDIYKHMRCFSCAKARFADGTFEPLAQTYSAIRQARKDINEN